MSQSSASLVEDRFSRFRLIGWWDQEKIRSARVLVIGAGALGNEILKNLALLGFENMVVVDMDLIDATNLSRSILYRSTDVGKRKVDVAAEATRNIFPEARVHPINANVVHGLGLGLFGWADVVLAGLDNREARLWINRACWKMNRPWIDGAIEGINGVARAFLPGTPPCYECTLGETDWEILNRRMSCNLLLLENDTEGKVATTPTISSVIAGLQVQEAVKLLHGLPVLAGKGFIFEGLNHTSYRVEYTENADCMSHYSFAEIVSLPSASHQMTLVQLHERAQHDLNSKDVILEFSRDVIHKLSCPACGAEEELFSAVGKVTYAQGRCSNDGQMRAVITMHSYSGTESYGNRTLDQLGLPLFDVFAARSDEREIAYLIAGDQKAVLGQLAAGAAH
ncbi:MAG TPA: ThiF family adenylyltransferase [Candidatus Angelobacter sp.]|jgi:molybdopterin/thiamine biosynthesis adenylyltransferase|nr:ThiF family adenylyltransferase [Candidatus Angelobacter sp.]